jgi:hypothetical protein
MYNLFLAGPYQDPTQSPYTTHWGYEGPILTQISMTNAKVESGAAEE